ncbi:glycosyltransferase family 4 protein [Winogradskyella thalassocola]|uniref:Glycosyltransferase involved in cell wall bisynthesis n=1 Tax=Winogradskyella thalassocola TaxID=262004 RepID=A0A1G7Z2K2_9FLAO|nr:glycosyltransferase family 4 protein [Winogradskyella thalassocola]SDH02420.1 Glycosyltransferase involved in cell wall bisynthesis [Winogradskyella thalassocola]
MIKILLIDEFIHLPTKGAPLFVMEMKYLAENDFDLNTLGFDDDKQESHQNFNVIQNRKNRILLKKGKFLGDRIKQNEIKEIIERIKPDLIHCHLLTNNALNVYEAIPEGMPVVQTLHGPNFFCPTSWGCIKKDSSYCELGVGSKCYKNECVSRSVYVSYKMLDIKLKPLLSKKVTRFHCPSKQIELVANRLGYANTTHIMLGLRESFLENEITHGSYGTKQIIFVGKMTPVKGVDYLLKAFQLLLKEDNSVKLILAGTGDHSDAYIKLSEELGIAKNVEFKGFVVEKELKKLFSESDICVVPSIWAEQFGMVGPEAMASGVPVIGSDIGGIPEWLSTDYGWLVKPRDIEGLKVAMQLAISNPKDLKIKGKMAREIARELYTSKRYNESLEELFKSIIDNE